MKKAVLVALLIAVFAFASAACAEEDGQNPVMNLIGLYMDETSQRASLNIICEGTDGAIVTIDWASSASENTEWVFSGVYDAENNVIAYEDCVRIDQVFEEDGSAHETVAYENGTGKLVIHEDWSISWVNDAEETGNDCLFVFVDEPLDINDGQISPENPQDCQ